MFERFDQDVRRAVLLGATEEVRRRGDRRVGTDHLLLAVLHGTTAPRVLDVDVAAARSAADRLDRAALASIGIDVGGRELASAATSRRRPPFTSGARTLLKVTLDQARREKARRVQARHLLHALLSLKRPDPAAELLDALGVDRDQARARLTLP